MLLFLCDCTATSAVASITGEVSIDAFMVMLSMLSMLFGSMKGSWIMLLLFVFSIVAMFTIWLGCELSDVGVVTLGPAGTLYPWSSV